MDLILRIDKKRQFLTPIFACNCQMLFGNRDHLLAEFGRMKIRMGLQKCLPMPLRVKYRGNLPGLCFPDEHIFLQWAFLEIRVGEPPPVIEAGYMPAIFAAIVDQHHLAQEFADAPVIFFISIRAHV